MAHINPVMDFRLQLEISLKDEKKGIVIADEYANPLKGLDMQFDITKSFDNKPTASTITIYNLSIKTYNQIYEKADAFRLSCARGENQDYVPFYTGYPVKSTQVSKQTILTTNEGFMAQDANAGRAGQNDLETEITLMNYGFAQLFKSYQSSVSAEMVINDCIEALGLPKGNIDTNIQKNIQAVTLPKGFSIRGDVSNTLDLLGKRCGFNWNTNDMQLNMYDKNRNDIKTYGIELNPDNSSTPERQDDKFKARTKTMQKASKKKGIKGVKAVQVQKISQGFLVRTQLLPHLQCGATCYMNFEMSDAKGEKYIYKIHHFGSNTGTECYTEIYCV